MKNLKRLTCGIAALALLLVQSHTAQAAFKGTLQGDKPLIMEINPNSLNSKSTALTVTFIDSKGRSDIEVYTVPVGEPSQSVARSGPIPKGTIRVIVDVDNPPGGRCLARMAQGLDQFPVLEELVEGDIRFVFNVV